MKTFENLKTEWANQPEHELSNDGPKKVEERTTFIKRKQRSTNIILLITTAVLVFFFIYISAYKENQVMFALLMMIGSLLVRIFVEFFSIKKLNKMNITLSANDFQQKLLDYYEGRKNAHFILTPLVLCAYAIGFIMLLPFFKVELSSGFYLYIIISSIVCALVIGMVIIKNIRKELQILKELKG